MSDVVQMDNTSEELDRTVKSSEGSSPSIIHLYLLLFTLLF